jgi:hypothetical protein
MKETSSLQIRSVITVFVIKAQLTAWSMGLYNAKIFPYAGGVVAV